MQLNLLISSSNGCYMTEEQEKQFSDWYYELESYGMRCERFYDDTMISDEFQRSVTMTKWLKEAFLQGVNSKNAD